jgi:hypothetical protein
MHPPMSPALQTYLDLEQKRLDVRQQNKGKGKDSLDEDALLDEMDGVWTQLSEFEITHLDDARAQKNPLPIFSP